MGGVSFNVKAPKKIEAHIQDFFGWRFGVNRNKPCIIYGRTKREFIWSEEKKAKESELVLRRCDTFQRRHAVKFWCSAPPADEMTPDENTDPAAAAAAAAAALQSAAGVRRSMCEVSA